MEKNRYSGFQGRDFRHFMKSLVITYQAARLDAFFDEFQFREIPIDPKSLEEF